MFKLRTHIFTTDSEKVCGSSNGETDGESQHAAQVDTKCLYNMRIN